MRRSRLPPPLPRRSGRCRWPLQGRTARRLGWRRSWSGGFSLASADAAAVADRRRGRSRQRPPAATARLSLSRSSNHPRLQQYHYHHHHHPSCSNIVSSTVRRRSSSKRGQQSKLSLRCDRQCSLLPSLLLSNRPNDVAEAAASQWLPSPLHAQISRSETLDGGGGGG